MKNLFKSMYIGLVIGEEYWRISVFNNKAPKWVSWIIMILSIPLNLLLLSKDLIVHTIKGTSFMDEVIDLYEHVVDTVNDEEEA